MLALAETIASRQLSKGQLAIYWLGQAGFAFKASTGQIIYVDPYLSDAVQRVVGFKRMMICPISALAAKVDLVICTHEHLDHMDIDTIPILAQNGQTHFAGPIECIKKFKELGLTDNRCHLLVEGGAFTFGKSAIHAVYADHGALAPDALGVILDFDGISVYHTGDTAYRPESFRSAVDMRPDILLPCINGAFGNMNSQEAAQLTQLVGPRVVIPTHFGMFVEHNGDPDHFLDVCAHLMPSTKAIVLKPGEEYIFERIS